MGNVFIYFLACFSFGSFWNDSVTHLSDGTKERGKEKWTNHNNHTLPLTAPHSFLFSKSGYTHMLALHNIQQTFIGNKLRKKRKPYGSQRFICKAPASKLFPDHTILAMFFQSGKIRKVTTDFPDGKHMSSGPLRHGSSCMVSSVSISKSYLQGWSDVT